ncbi:MAG: P-II family nitrogen regulator [Butyrivibrio sp.]|uniref:P-II family nitrogen regulator n=1 Tax=Butyrivibrio sp. TaxID=28121 RepID=UPI0025F540D9|nr:P-II family nitrogen regulator [Butyrivibrio sp.]MCR5771053.1 P-II family nitrogen regulator [Butyrivibrio sp.]
MKRLEIVIRPEKLEVLQEILDECGAHGAMVSNIQGYGNQKGHKSLYRGAELDIELIPKIKVETVVDDELVETIIAQVLKDINTGTCGDGKIFVYNVEEVVRIRTGEHGSKAL